MCRVQGGEGCGGHMKTVPLPGEGEGQRDHLPRKERAIDSRDREGAGPDHPMMVSFQYL